MTNSINFFSEDIDFELENTSNYEDWVKEIIASEGGELENINYIFCDDAYLLKINQDYLNHDYYTDIISFPMSEKPDPISGDIFISIDMVRENAQTNEVEFLSELLRVMAHGVLHFLGYKDKTSQEIKTMRQKEDIMIDLYKSADH